MTQFSSIANFTCMTIVIQFINPQRLFSKRSIVYQLIISIVVSGS